MADANPTPQPPADEPLTSQNKSFLAFHGKNPEVYDILVDLAREFIDATGKRKLSVGRLWEHARWDLEVKTKGAHIYQLNDHLCPYYARAIMFLEEDLRGIFDTRMAEADILMPHLRKAGSLESIPV